MPVRLGRWTSLATVSVLAIGVSVACGPITLPMLRSGGDSGSAVGVGQPASVPAQSASSVTPTPAVARPGALRPVPVTRESITETLALDGIATARAQEPVLYGWRAIVDDVPIKAGQSVKQGDTLVAFNPGEMPAKLDAARGRLQTSLGNLALAQAQAQASQAATEQRVAAEQQRQQQTLLDAQLALRRAQENLVKVQAGKSPEERQAAAATVANFEATTLATAQRALDTAMAGPDETTIRAAQRDVTNDQILLTRAQADLEALTRGPDPAVLRSAQAAVQRAQSGLQLAQAATVDPKAPDQAAAKIRRGAAVQDAQAALDTAEAQLAKLKQPPAEVDVQAAQLRVMDAESTLSTAQTKLEALQAGPDAAAVDDAQRRLTSAQKDAAGLRVTQAEVNSHPTPSELQTAQDQVRAAQAAVDNARQAPPVADAAGPDLTTLQAVVDSDQAVVAAAEQSLDNAKLRAPFDGTVISVQVRPGETTVPSRPVVILARPGSPIVNVDLDDNQVGRLAVGQSATVALVAGTSSVGVAATVASVTPAKPDGSLGASANLEVSWVDGQSAAPGTPVQVTVNLGGKQDVLVVPKSAVHQAGGRTTVEVQDGTIRRVVSVQTGISSDTSVEIQSGLSEGQLVLARPA